MLVGRLNKLWKNIIYLTGELNMPENNLPTQKKRRLANFMQRTAMVFILSAIPGFIVYNRGVNVFHWLTRPAQHQTDLRKIDGLVEAIENEGSHLSTKSWHSYIFGGSNKSQKEIENILKNINRGKTSEAEKKLNELYRDFTASISNNKRRMDSGTKLSFSCVWLSSCVGLRG